MSARFAPNIPSGAKAPFLGAADTAGLKPRPFKTTPRSITKSCNITKSRSIAEGFHG